MSKLTISTGVPSLLTILFISFKLSSIIDWSWWWIFCPLWLPWATALAFLAFFVVLALTIFAAAMVFYVICSYFKL